MLNTLAADQRELFFQAHDPHIIVGSEVIFHDGASTIDGTSGFDPLVPPPQDKYERAKRVEFYYQQIAQRALDNFERFRAYLRGTGRREDQWLAHLYTNEDSLNYLQTLSTTVQRARARAAKATFKAEQLMPPEISQERADEVAEIQRHQEFLQQIDSVKLYDVEQAAQMEQATGQAPRYKPEPKHQTNGHSKRKTKANKQNRR